jgi:hypothetical protein
MRESLPALPKFNLKETIPPLTGLPDKNPAIIE